MLTYSFENRGETTLYEYLYQCIREDIVRYRLSPHQKLPSKRALAKHLNISTVTVENAYGQLVAEGYLYSVPKSGYYVSDLTSAALGKQNASLPLPLPSPSSEYTADFVNNSIAPDSFPFALWTKLMRATMSDDAKKLMVRSPSAGIMELRSAIAEHLYQFRGITVTPEQIVIGAGTEYLYSLLIQLLGHHKTYAVEDPGYPKIARIYQANHVACVFVPLDENGLSPSLLEQTGADVLHISPSHHFPTGIVMPVSRRYELLSWASKSGDRYIIEDDFDSEFRLLGKPIPPLWSIDVADKVIYMNTFSKTLTSTIRISYMVLPVPLMKKYGQELGFYSCTVSNFEQYTLARFIREGYFEKHINRMRNFYRSQRDLLLDRIRNHPMYPHMEIREEHAGLHFLLKLHTSLTDRELMEIAAGQNIHISCLSQYFRNPQPSREHILLINYSGITAEAAGEALDRLFDSIRK
ncbi:MAG: PLP-dependent aminotransferase family protein [Lachnospiraceae bacterium]|nr:PLP-dependent aminotransferase family protein [Lachnospiraceae bacterium]